MLPVAAELPDGYRDAVTDCQDSRRSSTGRPGEFQVGVSNQGLAASLMTNVAGNDTGTACRAAGRDMGGMIVNHSAKEPGDAGRAGWAYPRPWAIWAVIAVAAAGMAAI